MKFCQHHWDMLRQAIKDRGMESLVPTSGAEAEARMAEVAAGNASAFDPLMACHWMIVNRAVEFGGLYLIMAKPDGGDFCPVCEAMEHTAPVDSEGKPWTKADTESHWINGPADCALSEARKLHLIQNPRLQ